MDCLGIGIKNRATMANDGLQSSVNERTSAQRLPWESDGYALLIILQITDAAG
ncbi:MAG: hypothetical protein WAO09_10500 [Candidatus Dormiibacterota bacterium]